MHWGIGDVLAIDEDGAGRGIHEAGDHAQGRSFSASGWSKKCHEVALPYLHIEVINGGRQSRRILLCEADKGKFWLCHCFDF